MGRPPPITTRASAPAACGWRVQGRLVPPEQQPPLFHEHLDVGDRVVIPSTIACGTCVYCRDGYYSQCDLANPMGKRAGTAFFGKNLTLRMGNCNHRKYIPRLIELVRTGAFAPERVLTRIETLSSAIEAYEAFDARRPGWMKVELAPPQIVH